MRYRVYFNRSREAPQVWSIDEGDQSSEINVQHVVIQGGAISKWNKSKPNDSSPSAWFEVEGFLRIAGGIAYIEVRTYVSREFPTYVSREFPDERDFESLPYRD